MSFGWQKTVVPEPASVMRTPAACEALGEVVDVVDVERHVVHARAEALRVAVPAGLLVARRSRGRQCIGSIDVSPMM